MNLADPELELIDPTPDIHSLFLQFDQTFFWTKLASRAVVKWSKRMYSCAGVCSYEGRGGLCTISLSEPLLKLRPRKDLIETLLHEMIHAFLFITNRDQDRDGHGPTFRAHMHRINMAAGLKISIYHSFHDEVELYQTHWWRCNGPCQTRKPHFGIVRRACNKAPGPSDHWWAVHQRKCGGTFIKFKEPEKTAKKTAAAKAKGDITKYVTSTKTAIPPKGEPKIIQVPSNSSKPVLTKSNSVSASQIRVHTVKEPVMRQVPLFTGKGNTLAANRVRSNSADVTEAVRNVWANKQISSTTPKNGFPSYEAVRNAWVNKQLPSTVTSTSKNKGSIVNRVENISNKYSKSVPNTANKNNSTPQATKHKSNSVPSDTPPAKVKKIDDFFKSTATSLLKDIYGQDIKIAESFNNNNKLVAIHNQKFREEIIEVDCPICKMKVDEKRINRHLDECLNKDIISKLCTSKEDVKKSDVVSTPPIKAETTIKPLTKVETTAKAPTKEETIAKPPSKVESTVKPPTKMESTVKPTAEVESTVKSQSVVEEKKATVHKVTQPVLKEIVNNIPEIPPYGGRQDNPEFSINYTMMKKDLDRSLTTCRGEYRDIIKYSDNNISKAPSILNDGIVKMDENVKESSRTPIMPSVYPHQGFDPKYAAIAKSVVKKIEFDKHVRKSDNFIVPKEETNIECGFLPSFIDEEARRIELPPVKLEPGVDVIAALTGQKCPCCGSKITKPIDEHLDECLAFFVKNGTEPSEGASTSFADHAIVIEDDEDDDVLNESQTLNATGTKLPCPCCMVMVEHDDMNRHLDNCLS